MNNEEFTFSAYVYDRSVGVNDKSKIHAGRDIRVVYHTEDYFLKPLFVITMTELNIFIAWHQYDVRIRYTSI